jgi:predicted PurR-regulated permease PerM
VSDAEAPVERQIPALHVRAAPIAIIVGAAALFALREAASVCVPVLVSILLAYALEPLVVGLGRWHVPRLIAAIGIYALLGVAAVVVGRSVGGQVASFLDDLPDTVVEIRQGLESGWHGGGNQNLLDGLRRSASREQRLAAARTAPGRGIKRIAVEPPGIDVRSYLVRGVRGVLSAGLGSLVVALLTFLLLATGNLFKRKIVKLAGPRLESRKVTVEVLHAIDQQIERYLVVRLIISLIVAGGTGLGLWVVGVANPAVWGLIAGALNVLPFAGPCLAVALITLAAFLQFETLGPTLAAGGAASIVAFVEGNILTPWLASRACALNTVAVFVSVLFWGWVWGIWGLLLAVPIMVAVKAAADRIEPLQPIGELLGV